MPEEERLSLVSEVEDEFTEPLQRLESALESVDDAIADTGRGRDYVRIDVEADISDAVGELSALDAGIDALDDDITIDVEADTTGVDVDDVIADTGRGSDHVRIDVEADISDAVGELEALDRAVESIDDDVTIDVKADTSDLLRDDVSVNTEGRGSKFIDESTGQFTSVDDAVDRRFGDIADSIKDHVRIDTEVSSGDAISELETLGRAVESIDDDVRIDAEVSSGDAISELEVLDRAVESIDDDVTIDVEADTSDLLREDIQVNTGGRGSQFIDESTGQFTSADDAVDRRFGDIADGIKDDLSVTGDVDTEVSSGDAISELEALDRAVESIDDDVTIDVEADTSDLLRDDVSVNTEGRGSQFIDESTGQFTSADDAVDRRFGDIADGIKDDFSITGDVDADGATDSVDAATVSIDATDVSIDAATVDADGVGSSGGRGAAMTSGGRPSIPDDVLDDSDILGRQTPAIRRLADLNTAMSNVGDVEGVDIENVDTVASKSPDTPHVGRFMEGYDAAGRERMAKSFAWLNDEQNPFDELTATDKLLNNPDGDVDVSVDEMRDSFGIDVPDVGDDDDDGTFTASDDDWGGNVLSSDFIPKVKHATKRFKKMRFTMGNFHQIIASLLPLLAVFVGAIPAAIVGIGALATAAIGAAAALAGIAGIGAVGMMLTQNGNLNSGPLVERLRDVGSTYLSEFTPLAKEFAPLLNSAIGDIERMAGPLADAASGLTAFRDEFRAASQFMSSAIPSFTAGLLAFTHASMPLIESLVGTIANMDFLGFFATQLNKALPALVMFGTALMELLPAIVHLSQGFLVVASVLTYVTAGFAWLMNQLPMVTTILGGLIGTMIVLVSVSTLWTLAAKWLSWSLLTSAKSALVSMAAYYKNAMAALLASGATLTFTQALVLLGTALGVGILLTATLSSKFSILSGNISDARKELKKFANQKNALDSGVPTGAGGYGAGSGSNPYVDNSTTVIEAGDPYSAARQQYDSEYERNQHRDSVFGN